MVRSIAPEYDYMLEAYEGLVLGRRMLPRFTSLESMEAKSSQPSIYFHPPPGIYSARDLVTVTSPLLNSVIRRLGRDSENGEAAQDILLNGLAASLAINGRESTLPLFYNPSDTSRKEVARQASKIGRHLVHLARETSDPESGDPEMQFYSQCEGHLWTPSVATLLLGRRSNPQLMALYNEWLHRMILLRDSLLPFENYESVPLVFANPSPAGLRQFEEHRKIFLVQCLSKQVSQSALVNIAKAFTAPDLPSGGYGFQYSQGLVLPAFLSGSSSRYLLRYHPARLDDSTNNLLFDYKIPLYYQAQKTELPEPTQKVAPGAWPPPSLLSLNPEVTKSSIGVSTGKESCIRYLNLDLLLDINTTVSVDLGQIARGRRYAYHSEREPRLEKRRSDDSGFEETSGSEGWTSSSTSSQSSPLTLQTSSTKTAGLIDSARLTSTFLHNTRDALVQTGLVDLPHDGQQGQIHILPAFNPLVKLALLGKLYPGNVILLDESQGPENAMGIGKGFGAKFVVLQDLGRDSSKK